METDSVEDRPDELLGQLDGLDDRQLVAVVDTVLDLLTDGRLRLPSDRERLQLLDRATRLQARVSFWQQRLAAEAEDVQAAWHAHGSSTVSYLSEHLNLTPKQAAHLVRSGQDLDEFPIVETAAAAGQLLPPQAEAITTVICHLSDDVPAGCFDQAQTLMVSLAASHNATELRRLSAHLLEVLAPDVADQLEADRLEAEQLRATRNRHLEFCHDGHGAVLIRGSLPVPDAEPFMRIIDSYRAARQRGDDQLDPLAEYLTPTMRRADALIAMVNHHLQQALAPTHGGDRPRVVVSVRYEQLLDMAQNASGQLTSGETVTPSVLRRWLCDADILPVVLGGASQVLDVGRAQRLVTGPIRAALEQRDRGCVFPGCDKAPQNCHAHHVRPWWAGGHTSLDNLVLVCPHHHGIVEPGHRPSDDRWQIRIRADGIPETLPPSYVDPARRPRLHARHRHRQRGDATPGDASFRNVA